LFSLTISANMFGSPVVSIISNKVLDSLFMLFFLNLKR